MHVELEVIDIDILIRLGADILDRYTFIVDSVENRLYCKTVRCRTVIARSFGQLYY